MKRLGKITALFIAIAIMVTGCKDSDISDDGAPLSDLGEISRQTSEVFPTVQTEERETIAPETEENFEAASTEELKDSGREFVTYSEPDEGHVFVDFDYIENAEGITDPDEAREWYDRALEALKETEEYKAFEEYVRSEEFDRLGFAEYVDETGEPTPQFERAFVEDFDGDGSEEAFVIVAMPAISYFDSWQVRYNVIYVGEAHSKVYGGLPELYGYDILDYGVCKQLIIYQSGFGFETAATIYGVHDDIPRVLYGLRGGYVKADCFLSASGWQGSGDFMYYDTAAHEYRAIDGKQMTFEEAFAMDTSGSLSEEKRKQIVEENMLDTQVVVIGGKYYLFDYGLFSTGEPYTYENGVFTECEAEAVRISRDLTFDLNHIEDIDYDAAVASMLTPEQAALL